MQAIQADTVSIHVIVPILPEAYDFYKKFIQGDQRRNVVYVQDILQERTEGHARRLPPGERYIIHYLFLGEDFWAMKLAKLTGQDRELMLKHKEAQDKILTSDMQRMIYPEKFHHYEYQDDIVKYEMEYFPHDIHDVIKLLNKMQGKEVLVRQYDLPEREFVSDLRTHLGL